MSRLGSRISADFLEKGQEYNAKRRTGEARVKVLRIRKKNGQVTDVEVEILNGGFDVGVAKYRKGDVVPLPPDTDFFEQSI